MTKSAFECLIEKQILAHSSLATVQRLISNYLNISPTNVLWIDVEDMEWIKEKLDEIIDDFEAVSKK